MANGITAAVIIIESQFVWIKGKGEFWQSRGKLTKTKTDRQKKKEHQLIGSYEENDVT